KPARRAELLGAIQEAIQRDELERQRHREEAELVKRLATLTPREREVLDLVVAGKLNKQIALELCTAEKTVKSHRGHIMAKLQVKSTAALVALFSRARAESSARPRAASSPGDDTSGQDSYTDPALDEGVKAGRL